MNRMIVSGCIAAVSLIGSAVAADAHDRFSQDKAYGQIQAERDRQKAMIEQGRSDGSLTWYEKYSLNREQTRVDQLERDALADGRLTRDEYRFIRQAQDDAARSIHAERHDGQVRGWWWRLWR